MTQHRSFFENLARGMAEGAAEDAVNIMWFVLFCAVGGVGLIGLGLWAVFG